MDLVSPPGRDNMDSTVRMDWSVWSVRSGPSAVRGGGLRPGGDVV